MNVPPLWRIADDDRRDSQSGESQRSSGTESIRSLALEYLRQTDNRRAVRRSRRSGAPSDVGWFSSLASTVLGIIALLLQWAGALGSALVAGCRYIPPKPLAVGLSLALVGALGAFAWNEWTFRTRSDELLRSTWAEFEALRDRDSDDPAWLRFKQDADSRLQRIAYELEHRAGPEDRVALELLWVARDYFPRVLKDKASRESHAERQLRFHFGRAESLMRQSAVARPDLDWLLVSVLTADGLLAIAAGLWFLKGQQRAP